MTNALNVRYASLGASAATFAALAALALTATMTARIAPELRPDLPPILMQPAPPVAPPSPRQPARPQERASDVQPFVAEPQTIAAPAEETGSGPIVGEPALPPTITNPLGALDCAVVSETPAGWGFGAAAVAIARDHRMAPATQDGRPVEGRYRMAVPFRLR
jgi:protein TonB